MRGIVTLIYQAWLKEITLQNINHRRSFSIRSTGNGGFDRGSPKIISFMMDLPTDYRQNVQHGKHLAENQFNWVGLFKENARKGCTCSNEKHLTAFEFRP
jgi:hypothetical protein